MAPWINLWWIFHNEGPNATIDLWDELIDEDSDYEYIDEDDYVWPCGQSVNYGGHLPWH